MSDSKIVFFVFFPGDDAQFEMDIWNNESTQEEVNDLASWRQWLVETNVAAIFSSLCLAAGFDVCEPLGITFFIYHAEWPLLGTL